MAHSARIVLTTFGSFGDVLPYLAIGRGLRDRGHVVVLAAPAMYREAAESIELEFAPVRPDVDFSNAEMFQRVMDPKHGAEVAVREVLAPCLRESFADLKSACHGADLLVSHVLTYAAPILGEHTGMPWVSSMLSPMGFCSAWEPPALAPMPGLAHLRIVGPRVAGLALRGLKRLAWKWSEPIRAFRRELGLPADSDPLWEGQHSPHGALALFSQVFGKPQPDWPPGTTQCGFPFYDADFGGDPDREQLEGFLAAGSAPVVFSLGSSGAHVAGDFYVQAVRAARGLGRRAVLVTGDASIPADLSKDVLAVKSTSVFPLFKAGCAVVHAGGIGTTSQSLRAATPQLIIPLSHDQFDNANRVMRLGIGGSLRRKGLSAPKLEQAIGALLEDSRAPERVAQCAAQVRAEDGVAAACAALERVIAHEASA